MVIYEIIGGEDTLSLTTEDIKEKPVAKRSGYVRVLTVAVCLLTSHAVVALSVYLSSAQGHGECQFVLGQWRTHEIFVTTLLPIF